MPCRLITTGRPDIERDRHTLRLALATLAPAPGPRTMTTMTADSPTRTDLNPSSTGTLPNQPSGLAVAPHMHPPGLHRRLRGSRTGQHDRDMAGRRRAEQMAEAGKGSESRQTQAHGGQAIRRHRRRPALLSLRERPRRHSHGVPGDGCRHAGGHHRSRGRVPRCCPVLRPLHPTAPSPTTGVTSTSLHSARRHAATDTGPSWWVAARVDEVRSLGPHRCDILTCHGQRGGCGLGHREWCRWRLLCLSWCLMGSEYDFLPVSAFDDLLYDDGDDPVPLGRWDLIADWQFDSHPVSDNVPRRLECVASQILVDGPR
jgi:hypothetical protein